MLRAIKSFFGLETRATDPDLISWRAVSGKSIDGYNPEQLSAVLGCVDLISSAIASLPAGVKDEEGERINHPLNLLIDRGTSPFQTWPDLIQWILRETLIRGNGLVEVRYRGSGEYYFQPIPWGNVSVYLLGDNRLRYDFTRWPNRGNISASSGSPVVRKFIGEVLHLRDISDDGLVGKSRLSRASNVVRHALALEEAVSALWDNGVFPSGIVSVPGRLGKESKEKLRSDIEGNFAGSANRSKLMIFDSGASFGQTSLNPDDAEILASRVHSVQEICRLFQVPPPLIQEYSNNTFTNSESASRWFSQFCLGIWIKKLEAFFAPLLEPQLRMDFDMSGFVRGDHRARWEAYSIALEQGVYSAEEIKKLEGLSQ